MPARRSRTLEWRRCLRQVLERGGALEIAVVNRAGNEEAHHLVWRVKLLALSDKEITLEQPITLGQVIHLEPGVELMAILAVGQNRWMFKTTHLGRVQHAQQGRPTAAMRVTMPQEVERCQRRNYYRMQTGGLNLPEVEVWPLLDPKSVVLAERANELQFQAGQSTPSAQDDATMPEVGPRFNATLLNIGGGGVGLRVRPDDAQTLARHKLFWIRFNLPTALPAPICATGKLAHTNVDSTQHTYAGMAFDFSFNPDHQRFVVEQICRYLKRQQEGRQTPPAEAA